MDFENNIPEWENEGTEPSEELKTNGFQAGQKPPAGVFNWFWSKVTKCITEIQDKILYDLVKKSGDSTQFLTVENDLSVNGNTFTKDVYVGGNRISTKDGHGCMFTSDAHWLEIFSNLVPHDESNRVGIRLQSDIDLKDSFKFYKQTNGDKVYFNVHGNHNKPTGTYTGDGSFNPRTIYINNENQCEGNILALMHGNGYCSGIVTPHGAIIFYNETDKGVKTYGGDRIWFISGSLFISSDSSELNQSGVTYDYQVL